jgi:hypothetical protein
MIGTLRASTSPAFTAPKRRSTPKGSPSTIHSGENLRASADLEREEHQRGVAADSAYAVRYKVTPRDAIRDEQRDLGELQSGWKKSASTATAIVWRDGNDDVVGQSWQ